MVVYGQIVKKPGQPAKVITQQTPPKGWDDSEEQELEWLARGASDLARESLKDIDKAKADDCLKKMLDEIKNAD